MTEPTAEAMIHYAGDELFVAVMVDSPYCEVGESIARADPCGGAQVAAHAICITMLAASRATSFLLRFVRLHMP